MRNSTSLIPEILMKRWVGGMGLTRTSRVGYGRALHEMSSPEKRKRVTIRGMVRSFHLKT